MVNILSVALHTFSIIGSFSVQSHHQSCKKKQIEANNRYFVQFAPDQYTRDSVVYNNIFMYIVHRTGRKGVGVGNQ